MKIKQSFSERVFDICNILFMCLLLAAILIPLLNILFSSLSNPMLVMKHKGMVLYPLGGIDFNSYKAVARNPNILSGYMNTLFIVIVGTTINLTLTVVAAYVLSRKNVMWGTAMTLFIVFTMYFSGGMIPFYLTVRSVGLDGSIWALIIPSALSTYNLIIMRTAMAAIPDSMEESAKIDGASHTRIIFSVMVPLAKATLAVITLNYAVSHWNAWFNAMIFLRDKTKFPLQLILKEILVQNDTSMMTAGSSEDQAMIGETIKHATIVAVTIPILCVYPFLQRYFVKGVMIGAVKG